MKAKLDSGTLEIERLSKRKVRIEDKVFDVDACQIEPQVYSLLVNGQSYQISLNSTEDSVQVTIDGHSFDIQILDEWSFSSQNQTQSSESGNITSSMPGRILKVMVQEKQKVEKGTPLLILEAMKMENEICAPFTGTVTELFTEEAQVVEAGEKLLTIG